MEDAANKWFHNAISILTYNRNQRVWSVIVTLFGDLARTPGDRISGSQISEITEPLGIRPEAMRVALHRLRNDGWLASEKSGRSSFYSLTEYGLRETEAASPRIYARSANPATVWRIVIQDSRRTAERQTTEKQMQNKGYFTVAPNVYLAPGGEAGTVVDGFSMIGTPETIPDWLRARTSPPELVQAYEDLEAALDAFSAILDTAPGPTPSEVATLRTVIVHNWRKALLSHPELPQDFFVPNWRGGACREKVMDILDRLGTPPLTSL